MEGQHAVVTANGPCDSTAIVLYKFVLGEYIFISICGDTLSRYFISIECASARDRDLPSGGERKSLVCEAWRSV